MGEALPSGNSAGTGGRSSPSTRTPSASSAISAASWYVLPSVYASGPHSGMLAM